MKVLFIGLGSIAKKHIAALNEIGEFEIHAYRSVRPSKVFEGIINVYEGDDLNIFDFFLITNPTSVHFETLINLKKYRKPIFIEKPVFNKVGPEEEKLVREFIDSKIPTYIGCNLRFLDSLSRMNSIFKNIRINEINIYAGSYLPDWRPGIDYKKTYSANKALGGGVHIDLIHELDYLFWMAGTPINSRATFKSNSSLKIDSVDYANYLWEYEDYCANIVLNYYRREPKRTFEIISNEGVFEVDLLKNLIYQNGEKIYSSTQTILDTYKAQMNYFISKVMNGDNLEVNNIFSAYKILQLCLRD